MSNIAVAVIGGLIGMLGFGISDFIAKKAIDKVGNLITLLYTQLFGIFFLLFFFIKDSTIPIVNIGNIASIVLFGLLNTIGYLALYKAFKVGKLSIVSPISSSYAILASVTSFLFFGETFSQIKLVTLTLIIIGVVITALDLKGFKNGISMRDLSKGVPEALLFFLVNGIYEPFWDKFLTGPGWVVWVILLRVAMVILLVIFQTAIKKRNIFFRGSNLFLLLIFSALFGAIASFGTAWGYHSSVNTTSIVAAVVSTYPLVTITLSFVFLKERLAKHQYFGIALIIIGLVISPFI